MVGRVFWSLSAWIYALFFFLFPVNFVTRPIYRTHTREQYMRYSITSNLSWKNCLQDFISTYITAYDFTTTIQAILSTIENIITWTQSSWYAAMSCSKILILMRTKKIQQLQDSSLHIHNPWASILRQITNATVHLNSIELFKAFIGRNDYPTALWRRRKNWTPRIRFETYSKGQNVSISGSWRTLSSYLPLYVSVPEAFFTTWAS